MTDVTSKQSMKERVKLEAQNEVQKELFEKAKTRLLELYRKKSQAEKIVKNIDNEIADYEMELDSSI